MKNKFTRVLMVFAMLSAVIFYSCVKEFTPEDPVLNSEANAVASNWQSGDVYKDSNNWTEVVVGNIPLVISVPHGGNLKPSNIPDRTCNNPTTITDANTRELARAIEQEFISKYNIRPYIIFCHLQRAKIDQNRAIADATCGNSQMETAWHTFHNYIDTALNDAVAKHGRAIYIDLHGHGHPNLRLELGYSLGRSSLINVYNGVNLPTHSGNSSINNLMELNPYMDFREMMLGDNAFGTMMENEGYRAVPSKQDPYPATGEAFFNGGYNTRHFTSDDYPNVYGFQIECNRVGLRDNATNRAAFAKKFAKVMLNYMDITEIADPVDENASIGTYQVTLDNPGYLNGPRFLNVVNGQTYGYPSKQLEPAENALYHQEKIDFVFLNGSSTGANFIAPSDASRLSQWDTGDKINANWLVKNEGTFIKLDASSQANALFTNAQNVGDLHDAYQQAQSMVSSQSGYSLTEHGSGEHVNKIQNGDVIFFRSSSKKILAAFKVTGYATGSAGSITLSAKVDKSQAVSVPRSKDVLKAGTLAVGGWSSLGPEGDTYHVDLANIKRHDPESADQVKSSIDMLNLWSGVGHANFMAPSNGAVTAWGSSTRIADWSVRNSGTFVRLSNPTQAENDTFDELSTRQSLIDAYNAAVSNITSRSGYELQNNGPATRVRRMEPGDIIYFKSNASGRNLYAAIRVDDITLGSSNGREVIDILVKSNKK
ncbi:hypothetical protein [Sinomicrobium sp.]